MGRVPIRRVAASGLVALGVLCALLTGVFRSVDSHFHDPESFLENTEALADNAGVRERLFEGFRAELISIAEGTDLGETSEQGTTDGEDPGDPDDAEDPEDAEDAPVDADIITDPTGPVTDETVARDQVIEEVLLDIFESDDYRDLFTDQLTQVQSQIIHAAELPDEALLRDPGEVIFDARRLYQPIYAALATNEATATITENEVPPGYGTYRVADRGTTVNAAWWLVENGPGWRGLTYFGAIAAFVGAVALAERRPTRVIQFGGGIVGLALVVTVVVFIIRALVPILASGSGGDAAVTAVYSANTSSLVDSMIRLLVVGVVLAVGGFVARLIWPDDWVYGQVSDDRGVRSIRRRRAGTKAAGHPEQAAAATPAAYPGHLQQPYPPGYGPAPYGYPGYPAQYPMYQQPYPQGPYAQPMPGYASGPRGTVPVGPPSQDINVTDRTASIASDELSLPPDAAGVVPRVVTPQPSSTSTTVDLTAGDTGEPTVSDQPSAGGSPSDGSAAAGTNGAVRATSDGWDDDSEW